MENCSFTQLLKTVGLKVTTDRHSIMHLFKEERCWSAQEICTNLSIKNLSTVYRNLDKFEKEGLIVHVGLNDGHKTYELAKRPHHDHQVCTQCRMTRCVPCPIPNSSDHKLEFFKTCSFCL